MGTRNKKNLGDIIQMLKNLVGIPEKINDILSKINDLEKIINKNSNETIEKIKTELNNKNKEENFNEIENLKNQNNNLNKKIEELEEKERIAQEFKNQKEKEIEELNKKINESKNKQKEKSEELEEKIASLKNEFERELREYENLFKDYEEILNTIVKNDEYLSIRELLGISNQKTKLDYLNLANIFYNFEICKKLYDFYSKNRQVLLEKDVILINKINEYYKEKEGITWNVLVMPSEEFNKNLMYDIDNPDKNYKGIEAIYCPGVSLKENKINLRAVVKGK